LIRVPRFVESAQARSYFLTTYNRANVTNVLEFGRMKFEQPTRGAFDRNSIRFDRLIELDLATRPFTAFGVITTRRSFEHAQVFD
jgi:hypothetical protein